jgi:hypothetical protein
LLPTWCGGKKTVSKNQLVSPIIVTALCLAAAAASSCSSKPKPPPGPVKIETFAEESGGVSFGGETVTDMTTTNAVIVTVDAARRTLGLRYPDGSAVSYKAGAEIPNFGQFKAGDHVQTTSIRALTVTPAPAGALPQNAGTLVRAPGTVLGAMPVQTINFTAKILAFEPIKQRISLQTADGQTHSVKVRDQVSLGNVNVGDNITIKITEALAIELVKT